jgi:hypothetical protein
LSLTSASDTEHCLRVAIGLALKVDDPVTLMLTPGLRLNRVERWLLGLALLLGGLLVLARLGTMLIVSYLHFHR